MTSAAVGTFFHLLPLGNVGADCEWAIVFVAAEFEQAIVCLTADGPFGGDGKFKSALSGSGPELVGRPGADVRCTGET